jgi:hypothetical protein
MRLLAPPLILVTALLTALRAEAAAPEYAVKAAFLYNFTKFVEWPPSAFHDDSSSLRLCVLGEDPFGDILEAVTEDAVDGRTLTVLRTDWMSDLAACQILFISRSERRKVTTILAAVRGAPVLTVADADGFLEKGGIINFILQGSKVRFEINQEVADQAGLKISSKLLRLASRVVVPSARPGP